MSGTPLVSVVLPVLNEERSLDACLAALTSQSLPGEQVEIIVVVGTSTDRTRAIADAWAERDPRVRVLDNPAKRTPISLNIGIRAARAAFIARMDGHAVAPTDYLELGLEVLHTTGAWAAGGQMRRVGTTPVTTAIALATMSPFGVGDSRHNYAGTAIWAETVFLGMWPRWVFERVGLFDEELVRNQDDELSYRIRHAGGRIRFDPRIVIDYEPRPSLKKLFSQYRQYAMWKVRVMQMHPTALRWRHFAPMALLGALATGAVAGLRTRLAWTVTAGLLALYGAVMTTAAARLAGANRRLAPRVLATLITLHAAYGIGFWQGLVVFATKWALGREGRPDHLEPRER